MKDLILINLLKRLAVPLLAAFGGFIAGQYPGEFAAFCNGVGL